MLIQDGYDKNRLAGARYDINGRSPTATAEYFKYDASGNVWYDRHAKTAYKLNAAGLPEVAYIQNEYDADLTLSSVNSGSVDDLSATMYMTYDETGSRVWTRVQTPDMDYGAPSVVLFEKHLFAASSLVLIFSKKLVFHWVKSKKWRTVYSIPIEVAYFICNSANILLTVRSID
jgi:hypothetical protein